MLLKLIWSSVKARRGMALLTMFSIAISMAVLLSVAHLEAQLRSSFERNISGVDVIVGSRTSSLNLLLFSVFKIGYPTNNLNWQSYREIAQLPQVKWAIPMSLGDSHQGYGVVGTTTGYFQHYKYGAKQALVFAQGHQFSNNNEVVLGASVAKALNYSLGDSIVLAHGTGKVSFTQHKQFPFTVVGILAASGTASDRSLYIPIEAIDHLHQSAGGQPKQHEDEHHAEDEHDHAGHESTRQVSAVLLGAKSPIGILHLQRAVSQFSAEPLSAIMPGVALQELWQLIAGIELSLKIIALLVMLAALIGLITMLLASMRERQRELSVLRAMGAKAWFIVLLVECEAVWLTLLGSAGGYALLSLTLAFVAPWLLQEYALTIATLVSPVHFATYLGWAIGAAAVLALIPALSAYKKSVVSGLSFN